MQCCLPCPSDEMCIERISGIQKELQNLASFDMRVFFCSLLWGSQIENHPQEDLAKISYKESFLCITKSSTCCQMRHFFSFFSQKFRKMAKTKTAKIVNLYFFFKVFSKIFTKKDKQSNIISLESCLVLVTDRNPLSK